MTYLPENYLLTLHTLARDAAPADTQLKVSNRISRSCRVANEQLVRVMIENNNH